ncbi:hypothetical protein SAMN05421787_104248 [Virgibacillus pantothenticus]|uniref:Uncharacterized protein n=1 Tax=Virgibacillus pantothenticus TaxID=1473 RepID=A0A0L0QJX8_VIRPA|nr:hypothetical protein AFK71_09520 [Virgibacillus pantothenticus]SIS83771.1 hypothetical protein SAMN05421787_104248 [Virgibacillus pantothenticus]
MNKYHKSSLKLIFIIAITLILSTYWLNLKIGYGIVFLFVIVGYTIYRNFKASKNDEEKK